MEIIDNAQHKEYASKSLGNTALGFGIAGTAIALLSGGMGLFGAHRNAGSCNNGCNLTCEDKVELAGAIYQGRINELQERFNDRQVIDNEERNLIYIKLKRFVKDTEDYYLHQ